MRFPNAKQFHTYTTCFVRVAISLQNHLSIVYYSESIQLHSYIVEMSCKSRVRKFYSKGAYLVLAWTLLVSATAIASLNLTYILFTGYPDWLVTTTLVVFLPIIFCLGYLANYKLQDYTIARIGIIAMFLVTVVFSIYVLILSPGL